MPKIEIKRGLIVSTGFISLMYAKVYIVALGV
ncbi:Uncharacterised protein [Streptococcus pneumoniae]|nr:Uncharacterised protein [Streptococcus pneumoniae]COG35868.1 Uncharacterised protein [Streptococcus pneumoniae]CRF97942.1 Uncharacterised protein [Streptococcus pneumoniae]